MTPPLYLSRPALRVPTTILSNDDVKARVAACFTGDEAQARRHLEDHQGVYILAALREAGVSVPVVMSYDFDGEPRRFKHLESRYAPLSYLTDDAGPAEIRAALGRAGGG